MYSSSMRNNAAETADWNFDDLPEQDLSLYVHFPYCVRKCRYCDFLSFPCGENDFEAYTDRVCEEIRFRAGQLPGMRLRTVFFGGGTPSLMQPQQAARILQAAAESFAMAKDPEITMECNPGTVDYDRLVGFRQAGINRLSFGLQSMKDDELAYIGRIHTRQEFLANYAHARKAGFENINIDLMSALPGQSLADYEETLRETLALQPEHISAYSLIIEEGTPFWNMYGEKTAEGALPLPDEDAERAMYYLTKKLCMQHGYQRYEISNYAKPGRECRHNLVYWYRGNYLGVGLGASGMIGSRRFRVTADLEKYFLTFEPQEVTALSEQDKMEETMFLGLRCRRGISTDSFRRKFGMDIWNVYGPVLEKYERSGHLVCDREQHRIRLTDRGIDVSNIVLADFLL